MDRNTNIQQHAKHIALFFTYGVSLSLWRKKGMFEREMALYKRLAAQGYRFSFFTYSVDDQVFVETLKQSNITVYYKHHRMPRFVYSLVLPWLYRKPLRGCDILKTNQMLGSWTAVIAKWITGKPLLVRTGYMFSTFAAHRGRARHMVARAIEWFACRFADRVVVATEIDKRCFRCSADHVEVIPNYVDMALFADISRPPRHTTLHVLFVGRLEPQKNVSTLLRAVAPLSDIKLTILGDGSQRAGLEALAKKHNIHCDFLGQQPYALVREYFAKSDLFVLPSLYEGLPKVLLEAMAAGLPIVTTNVPGIATMVEHKKTAYVVEPTEKEMREGIIMLRDNQHLAEKLGDAARKEAAKRYSLDAIIDLEQQIYDALL